MFCGNKREPIDKELRYIVEQMEAYVRKTGVTDPMTVAYKVTRNIVGHHRPIADNVGYHRVHDIILGLSNKSSQ